MASHVACIDTGSAPGAAWECARCGLGVRPVWPGSVPGQRSALVLDNVSVWQQVLLAALCNWVSVWQQALLAALCNI